jgi:acyl dehydratase
MSAPHQLYWDDAVEGATIPPIVLNVSYEKVAMVSMATWDLFPGHNDPNYAAVQHQKTIYLNTIVLQGFADRVLTDWAGHMTSVVRRKLMMTGSVYAGDTLTGKGRTERVYRDDDGRFKIDVSISLTTQDGPVCAILSTAILPPRPATMKPARKSRGVDRERPSSN